MRYFDHAETLPLFKRMVDHVERGEPTLASDVLKIPVSDYLDVDRWEREVDEIFRRKPMILAVTGELREPGSYRAMTIAGVPILLTRLRTGEVRLFVNACRHRGVPVVAEGSGRANRFTCVYHAWTYAPDGKLIAVPEQETFGDFDRNCYGLTALAVEERGGLIWGVLTPGIPLELDEWLGEMTPVLAKLDLTDFEVFDRAELEGKNWKLTWEGYIETYHFASLHKNSFASFVVPNRGMFDAFGRHMRLCVPMRGIADFQPKNEEDESTGQFIGHALMVFPSTEITLGYVPGDEPLIRTLFAQVTPGTSLGTSQTTLRILVNKDVRGTPLEEEMTRWSEENFTTVREEDYPVVGTIQNTLRSGANESFLIGRNEIGIQHFHAEVNAILDKAKGREESRV
ncbi:aromatic ring-hydroxylating oxygenase subunit alpha [Sphingomonas sp.]|uniref:aromatic ring-hydroxylating oxygenase subunit alpha n=1 Tax=Sphingomonas sp. TaxID=28214 RepID=UPI003B00BC7B